MDNGQFILKKMELKTWRYKLRIWRLKGIYMGERIKRAGKKVKDALKWLINEGRK